MSPASGGTDARATTEHWQTGRQRRISGLPLVALNGWDPAVLERFRSSDVVKSIPGGIDSAATIAQLEEIAELIPEEWLPAAVGTPEACAAAWKAELDAGADGVVIHGSTPDEFAPALEAYRALRG